jgi:hypothetical protein
MWPGLAYIIITASPKKQEISIPLFLKEGG